MAFTAEQLWLIPALPLAAAALGTFLPRRMPRLSALLAIGAMLGALVLAGLALSAALEARATGAPVAVANFTWFEAGDTALRLGWLLDPLGALLAVMVTFVGTLIFVFSVGYMQDDPNAGRFFVFLSLFAAGMLALLLANSLLLLFLAWEIVGLASYLLIGFWFQKPAAAAAAKKAFLTTRLGDLGLLLGLLWLQDSAGTLLFYDGGQGCLEAAHLHTLAAATVGGLALSTAIGLLIFCGAAGKSGQFPLHVWLPDAMEGPTPVSALIHAATMVAAGVFLVVRVFPLLTADQARTDVTLHALPVITTIGTITALLGAVLALAQHDLKRVLAYSTVSQLGYMMLAVGVGAWPAAIFHLLTHAFFKALLFLGAGSVIHATHHEQDIRRLGGLRGAMPVTFLAFVIGMLALSGAPLLFSGFWSKEEILHAALDWPVSRVPFLVALGGAGLTAFYMTRLTAEVFLGARRATGLQAHAAHALHPTGTESPVAVTPRAHESGGTTSLEPHESPRVMTLPLVLLAIGAIALGFLGTPAWPWLQVQLSGGELHADWHHLASGWRLMAHSTLVVAAGMTLGWVVYIRRPRTRATAPDPFARVAPALFGALNRRLGFDELYAATFGRLLGLLTQFAAALDRWLWEGAARATAAFARFVALLTRDSDESGINAGFDRVTRALRRGAAVHSESQTGEAHGYLRLVAVGFVVLTLFLVLGGGR